MLAGVWGGHWVGGDTVIEKVAFEQRLKELARWLVREHLGGGNSERDARPGGT